MEFIQMLEEQYKKAQHDRIMGDRCDYDNLIHETTNLGDIKDVYRRTKNEVFAEHMGALYHNIKEIKQFNEDLKKCDIISTEMFNIDTGKVLIKYSKAVNEVGKDYGVIFHNTSYEYIEAMLQPYKELYPNVVFNH
jgi:exoribonuclease II